MRSFPHDSLGRLSSATNVESGTTGYTYYDNGNVWTVTMAGAKTKTYVYEHWWAD